MTKQKTISDEEETITKPKFLFKDKVKVINGFYDGCIGLVRYGYFSHGWVYTVEITNAMRQTNFNEKDLSLVSRRKKNDRA